MKPWLFLFSMIAFSFQVSAQHFGGFPPSTRWKQINTDTARIIYSPGAEWQANRIATLLHKAAADTQTGMGDQLRKINIVLQSRTTAANGYVALSPYRSEFYLVPGSNIFDFGNLPWYENLAIHEYRHVQQYNNFRHGLSKGFGVLFGEQGLALASALTIPDWFFEGDAVHSETALTPQGRGRQAFFLSGYNSLWTGGKNYSWHKLRNGSLKDYVPNHYQLGYLLANYGYLKYGNGFWRNVTKDASAFKGLFYPFQKAVKKYSGTSYRNFRQQALEFYRNRLPATPDSVHDTRTVVNYYYARPAGDGRLIYLKTGYDRIPAFYMEDSKGEHKLALQDISSEEWFSYNKGTIAYTAFSTNARWSLVDYSDIVLMDQASGKRERITSKARYFTPDISPSGNRIVAVKITDSLRSELQLLNRKGLVTRSISSRDGELYVNPRFVDENRVVVGLRTANSRITLQLIDLSVLGKPADVLIPETYAAIGQPYVRHDTIFFSAGFQGNDDIYALKLKDKKIFKLTSGVTGNYFPAVFSDSLVWSHFTAEGLQLRKEALDHLAWSPMSQLETGEQAEFYPVAFPKNILSTPTERYASKRYESSTGLLHFHSWAPSYSDPEFSFSLYSDNILNTFSNELYYRYNQNERSHALGWNSSYAGWYPVINAGVEYNYNRHLPFRTGEVTMDQFEARIGYNIPLSFTKGRTYRFLNFGSNLVASRSFVTGFYKDSFEARTRVYLHHFVNFSHYLPMAVQHIYPRLGYTLSANLRHFIDDPDRGWSFMDKAQWLLNAQVFLPSIRNHSIVLSGSFQSVDTQSTSFVNRFANSRGYTDYYFRKMWRASANYHFPIAYPDFGFANIVYLQRLRGNLFFDYTRMYTGYFPDPPTTNFKFRSVGAELFFDTKWWNQLPVSFGIRVSHLLDNGFRPGDTRGSNWLEFILPVGLITN